MYSPNRRSLLLGLFSLAVSTGCKVKRGANESDADYKARLKAIYSAQAVLGLDAAGEVVQILELGRLFDLEARRSFFTINEQINTGLDQVRARLKDGLKGEPLDKLMALLTDAREANRRMTLGLGVEAKAQVDLVFEVLLFALESLAAVLDEAEQPTRADVETKLDSLRIAKAIPAYVPLLIDLARKSGLDALRINRLNTSDAWAKAETLSMDLHRKNDERLKALSAQVF